MSERGEYRPIHSVLLDSPEFQVLSKDAKLLWFALKITLGMAGIGIVYDDQLAERAGLKLSEVEPARRELIRGEWLYVQKRVHWLRNGLRFEPTVTLSNENHRKAVIRTIQGLPKLQIVTEFAAYYELPPPFPAMASEGHPDGIPITVTTTEPETTKETESAPKARGKRSAKVLMPEGWEPNATHTRIAGEERVDLAREATKYREHATANARKLADWDAGFCTWLRRAAEFARARPTVIRNDFGDETARDVTRQQAARQRQSSTESRKRDEEEEQAQRDRVALNDWWEELDAENRLRVEVAAKERCKGHPPGLHRVLTLGVMEEYRRKLTTPAKASA